MAKVHVSLLLEAPIEQVWQIIRDFNALPQWHPLIVRSRIEEDLPGTTVGCVRNFDLADDGGNLREQLLAFSDLEHFSTYNILDSALPLRDYVATLRLIPVTEGNRTLGQWQAEFGVPAEQESAMVELVTSVFREGLRNLAKIVEG